MEKPVFQNHRNVGGYDCEFVQRPPGFLQTDCSVCLLVLRSAHISTCCGHNFCKECIGRIHKDGKRCPLCNGEGFSLTYNRAYDVTLKQLEVYCTHCNAGCGWKGKLESLDEHLNVNPELEKQLEGCDLVEVLCYHDGCGQPFQRCLISEHQLKECPWRPYSCEHCHEYDSTYHNVVDNHWPVCECYPVPCPHKCPTDLIERQNLDKHLNEECPLQEVECDFKSAGCQAKLPRKDMPGHLKENVGHITLLARQNQELMAKLLEKEEEMRRMNEESRREMAEIKQQFQVLTRQRISDLESKALQVGAPVDLVMPNFERHRKDNDDWYSNSFDTHPQGYKMCLEVHAGGRNDARGTHVSCYVCLMRGVFDDHLKWPFRGVVTVQLRNQREDVGHHYHVVPFDHTTPSHCSPQVAGKGVGWGYHHKFFPLCKLDYDPASNCQYLANDCLYFRVKVVI